MTGHHWAQFTVGRIIAYSAVGLVENAVPAYNAETSPAAARGLMSGSIMLLTSLGNLWGAGMSRAYASTTEQVGWLVPTAMQLIPAVGILAFVPFTPESPRWLLLKGRRDEALKTLNKIRPKQDVANGVTVAEVDAIQQLIQESLETEEGSWLDFLKGNYPRRIWVSFTPQRSLPTPIEGRVRKVGNFRSLTRCRLYVHSSSSDRPTATSSCNRTVPHFTFNAGWGSCRSLMP